MYTHSGNHGDHRGSSQTGVRDLRANLAEVLRRAHAGHSTTITQHGQPIAVLGPTVADHQRPGIDALVAARAIRAPARRGPWRPPVPTPIAAGTRIDLALRDLRG